MSKNVIVISTSPRKNGNSEMLADEFVRGAKEAGNNAEKISLYDKTIGFCKGCFSCKKTHKCIIRDDVESILQKMLAADVVVFATPIYYYEMCGQMKTLLDRCNPMYFSEYSFRDIYLLAPAADDDGGAIDGAVNGLKGWIACFPKTGLAGTVFAGGVNAVGEIKGHPSLKKAYEMGKAV